MTIYIRIPLYTHSRCLKELLDSKSATTRTDKEGNNALHIACIHGQLHIVQFLLQHGLSAESRYVCASLYSNLAVLFSSSIL